MDVNFDSALDVGYDLEITKVRQQATGAGTWVCGTLSEHRFEALIFPQHAAIPNWEIGDSRISKLWVQRLAERRITLNWDRGEDVRAADELTQSIFDFLAGGLVDHIYR